MSIKKLRWSKVYESSEEELLELFNSMSIDAKRFELDAFEDSSLEIDNSDITIWCAEGSFELNKSISMQPGDYAIIQGRSDSLLIASGIAGCAYYISSN